jgi:hypothetical protein
MLRRAVWTWLRLRNQRAGGAPAKDAEAFLAVSSAPLAAGRERPLVPVLLLAALLPAAAAGAQTAAPPRDRRLAPPGGTGVITGRVVDGATGTPLPRARVRLNSSIGEPSLATTDSSGTFRFTRLPAGDYSLTAEKSAYRPATYPGATQTLRGATRSLRVAGGQSHAGLTLPLFRASAIAGRVVDPNGDPVDFAELRLLRLPKSGRGNPQMRAAGATNDIGEFRVAGLEPGSYLLVIVPRRAMHDDSLPTHPVPTFYPGVTSPDQAQPIVVERGMSVLGIEMVMAEGVLSTVTGAVVDSRGQPVTSGGSVNALVRLKGAPNGWAADGTSVQPDGSFQLKLPPGEYELQVHATGAASEPLNADALRAAVEALRGGVAGSPPAALDALSVPPQHGGARVAVGGDLFVTIVLGGGASASGRVIFDGTSPLPPLADNRHPRPGISFSPADGMCRMGRVFFGADLTFSVDGLIGTCTARVTGASGAWVVKAARYGNVDLLDAPITFEPGQQLRDIEVILTDKKTELAFQVSDESGRPTRDYVALVFSVDRQRWTAGSRYLRTYVAPAEDTIGIGERDTIDGLPAGDYYVVAVPDIETDAVREPGDILEALAHRATRVTLADDSKVNVSLRLLK